jgi:predicted Zn-dependent protease
MSDTPAELPSSLFDGRQARPIPVRLSLREGVLHIHGEGVMLQFPERQVRWPERQRHGARIAYLPDGSTLQHADGQQWDRWARASGHREGQVVGWMQSWRKALAASVLLVAASVATWVWGVPLAGHAALAFIPQRVDESVGEQAMQSFEQGMLQPSKLGAQEQAAIRQRFEQAMKAAFPNGSAPHWQLYFRGSKNGAIGPNAFALPGGHVVLTDEMVAMLKDRPDTLVGVLAHELGHVQHRHGMQMVVQASLLSGMSALVLGDVSGLLAVVPVVLAQSAYSRDAEHQADVEAARTLKAAGIPPTVMVELFERIATERERRHMGDLPIALADHPADAERIAFFKNYR